MEQGAKARSQELARRCAVALPEVDADRSCVEDAAHLLTPLRFSSNGGAVRAFLRHAQSVAQARAEGPGEVGLLAELLVRVTHLAEELRRSQHEWVDSARRGTGKREEEEAAARWRSILVGSREAQWTALEAWASEIAPKARWVFRAICMRAGLPEDLAGWHWKRIREDLLHRLVGGSGGLSGVRDIALRAYAVVPGSEVDLLQLLSDTSMTVVAKHLAVGPAFFQASKACLPGLEPAQARAAALVRRLLADPPLGGQILDYRLGCRLLQICVEPGTSAERTVRACQAADVLGAYARGRLRALAARELTDLQLLDALLSLDGLAWRTRMALGPFLRGWLWSEMKGHFPLSMEPVTSPCTESAAGEALPSEGADPDLNSTWICRAVLLVGPDLLERWILTGDTSGRNSRFDTLRTLIPRAMADGLDTRGKPSYHRFRALLHDRLDDIVADWLPALRTIAELPDDRKLKARTLAILAERWHPDIQPPAGHFNHIRVRAREAVHWHVARNGGALPSGAASDESDGGQ